MLILSLIIYFTPIPSIDYSASKSCEIPEEGFGIFSHDYPEVLSCEKLEELRISLKSEKTAAQHRKEAEQEAKNEAEKKERKEQAEAARRVIEQKARDEEEERRAAIRVVHPVNYANRYVTSPYGEARDYYIHDGVDFGVDLNSDISALNISRGEVTYSGDASNTPYSGCGIMVAVYHAEYDVTSVYCHLSSASALQGAKVEAGETVGTIGTTGMSTGIHLHFMIVPGSDPFRSEAAIDPLEWLESHGV